MRYCEALLLAIPQDIVVYYLGRTGKLGRASQGRKLCGRSDRSNRSSAIAKTSSQGVGFAHRVGLHLITSIRSAPLAPLFRRIRIRLNDRLDVDTVSIVWTWQEIVVIPAAMQVS